MTTIKLNHNSNLTMHGTITGDSQIIMGHNSSITMLSPYISNFTVTDESNVHHYNAINLIDPCVIRFIETTGVNIELIGASQEIHQADL